MGITEAGMARKTGKMLAVEKKFRQPLEQLIPQKVNDLGFSEAAKYLGLSKATLGYWMLKLQIRIERVALGPNETIEIKRARE